MKIKINVCDAKFLLRVLKENNTPRSMRIHDSIVHQLIEFSREILSEIDRQYYIDYINERYGTK